MAIDVEEVKRIAKLAHLRLSEEETRYLSTQINEIIKYFDQIETASDSLEKDWRPDILGEGTFEREDSVIAPFPVEETVALAEEKTGSAFQVPKIIE